MTDLIIPTFSAIKAAIMAGVAMKAHKGDIQDMVLAAVAARRSTPVGATYLRIEEAAYANRTLEASGYVAPVGFKRNG